MKKKKIEKAFLPVSKDEMVERGWYYYDFLVVTADAYIDHPSFGTAIIARVLEHEGYRVAVLAQPDWHSADAFRAMGRPRYGVMIGGGNIDSMVAHYTAAKKRRTQDLYSPGSRMGLRPDRPTIVYANRCREAFGNIPIVVGGLEASLRRFAHYDYWDDKVRRALIFDAQADLLVYGMGEYATREIARRLSKGEKADTLTDIRGTAFVTRTPEVCAFDHVECPSYEEVCGDKHAYALATKLEYEEHDPIRGKALWQAHGRDTLVVNPPAMPLSREELDEAAELPYPLHIMVRYEIERMLFAGEATAKDIPALWNRFMDEYLGIPVPDDTRGCLQDTHWSGGSFGYFPTYALGSAYDAMFVPAMCRDGVDLNGACASGDLAPVRAWLGEHIWQWGRAKDAPELIKGACGMAFDARYYCSYLQDKFTTLYEL